MKTQHISEIQQMAIDYIKENCPSCYGCDLHNEIFNTDYFIIGTYQAKKWLENGPGVFEAIEEIKEYEQDNFGEVNTDLSDPEKVCNMYAYIIGERVLNESEALSEAWNRPLTDEDREAIANELEAVSPSTI